MTYLTTKQINKDLEEDASLSHQAYIATLLIKEPNIRFDVISTLIWSLEDVNKLN